MESISSSYDAPTTYLPTGTAHTTLWMSSLPLRALWRGQGRRPDEIVLAAGDARHGQTRSTDWVLQIPEDVSGPLHIGRLAEHAGVTIDLKIRDTRVSKLAAQVFRQDGRIHLRRLASCSSPIIIGNHPLERGEARPLVHGQPLAIGPVRAFFSDGRYVPPVVGVGEVDEVTGLLGRFGMAHEIAVALGIGRTQLLVVGRPQDPSPASRRTICEVAQAIHLWRPAFPVARWDRTVALLLTEDDNEEALTTLAEVVATTSDCAIRLGWRRILGPRREAPALLERVENELALAIAAVPASEGPIDLDAVQIGAPLQQEPEFQNVARAWIGKGGQAVLLTISDCDILDQSSDQEFLPALTRELTEIVRSALAPPYAICSPSPGVIALATAPNTGATLEGLGGAIASEWHSRGPIRLPGGFVSRSLCVDRLELVDSEAIRCLSSRHREQMKRQHAILGVGIESLPLPLAEVAMKVFSAPDALGQTAALLQLFERTLGYWTLVLASTYGSLPDREVPDRPQILTDLQALRQNPPTVQVLFHQVRLLLRELTGKPHPLQDVVTEIATTDGAPRPSFQDLIQRLGDLHGHGPQKAALRPVQEAVRDLVRGFRSLWTWNLVVVQTCMHEDPFLPGPTVSFHDFTGTLRYGVFRQISLAASLRIAPGVYLTRFVEGLVVPLGPSITWRTCGSCNQKELFLTRSPVLSTGETEIASATCVNVTTLNVKDKNLPPGFRGT